MPSRGENLSKVARKNKKKTKKPPGADTLLNDASDSDDSISGSCERCNKLKEIVDRLEKKIDRLEARQASSDLREDAQPSYGIGGMTQADFILWKDHIDDQIEDLKNRQMRQTLIFKNIPEDENEKKWEQTHELLANELSEVLGVDDVIADGMINRCHRGSDRNYYKGEKKSAHLCRNA